LLAGVDQYSTRAEHLYDSLKVVSVDTKAKTIAMVSVPRDSSGYPLYFGGTGHIKINSIPTYVKNGWLDSPDEPLPTLVKEISYLVGVPINYYGVMDLGAFMKIIDLVGGVDINNDSAINDPSYDWMDGSPYGFALSAGPHHLNGRNALAYTSTATATAATSCLDLGKVATLSVKLFGTESRYYGKKQPWTC
jgi:LCP family protein required for cell wall assembly